MSACKTSNRWGAYLFAFGSIANILHTLKIQWGENLKFSVARSYLAFWDTVDCSLPGSSVHGILQARILEWVVISFSRGFFWLRDQTLLSGSPALAATWEVHKIVKFCIGILSSAKWIVSLVAQLVKNSPAVQEPMFDPWVGKIPWRREWQPTPVLPGLENSMKRGVGQATVHRVTKSWTWLCNELSLASELHCCEKGRFSIALIIFCFSLIYFDWKTTFFQARTTRWITESQNMVCFLKQLE